MFTLINEPSIRKFTCPKAMEPHCQKVFAGEYNPQIEFPSPRAILDIGANVGSFTLWAKKQWPEASIFAFEPMPDNAELLRQNTAGLPDVKIVEKAVRALPEGETPLLRRGKNNCGEASFFDLGGQLDELTAVNFIHPKALPDADFIKIDTEGCEWEIIQQLDLSAASIIALEWHRMEDKRAIRHFLRREFQAVKIAHTGKDRGVMILARRSLPAVKSFKRMFLALPIDHGATHDFYVSLMQLHAARAISFQQGVIAGDSLVPRARNTLATDFLHSYECTGMLCIDSDLKFSPEQVKRICSHRQDAIVAGCYAKKMKGPAQWVLNADPDHQTPDENGLQKIRLAGTGFMYAPRIVLETMAASYPEIAYIPDHKQLEIEYDFFSVGVYKGKDHPAGKPGRYMSEDWFFCQRALDIGISVYADTRVVPWHTGEIDFPLEAATPLDNSAKEQAANGGVIPPLGVFPPEPGVTA